MPDWSSRLDIVQPVLFPMLPYKHLGLLASTNRALRAAIDKIGRNFTFVNRPTSRPDQDFEEHEFTIYSLNSETLKIRTLHPYTPSMGFKLEKNEWFRNSPSTLYKKMPYGPDARTEYMPLALYKAGCKILETPVARNETKIWFSKTPMGTEERDGKLVNLTELTLFLGCNLGQGGFTISWAHITYLTDDDGIVITKKA